MANTNPLFDDLEISSVPPAASADSSNPLFSDLGISKGGTDLSSTAEPDAPVSAHPITDEVSQITSNITKQLPRNIMKGLGDLADIPGALWDTAFHPDEDAHPMAHLVAEKLADRLEKNVPHLKPVNQGPIERIVGAGVEAAPSALIAGPEAAAESLGPTVASGAASQAAQEAGAGPVAQTIAGLAPFAPSALAGATRGLLRGGEEGATNTAANLKNAKEAGIDISTGQATENPTLQAAETVGSKIPGGKPLKETRGAPLNQQVEASVDSIVKKLAPDTNQKPPTPTEAGTTIKASVDKKIEALNNETTEAKEAMEKAVGGKDTPMAAPKLEAALAKVTGGTGVEAIDNLVTGSKTKAINKAVSAVTDQPKSAVSYSSDGEGAHVATSPNGETHAVETATGDLKVTRSDTSEEARGKGEGTDRLEALAHAATGQGKNLVSDISVSPAEGAAYEKLGRKGWTVEKNPNAEVNPATGNTISDSPKNPVYTVKAPKTQGTGKAAEAPTGTEKQFTGEWSYNPKTGQSEPGVSTPQTAVGPQKQGQEAVLNQATPHTFDSLRQLRTLIGRGIKSTRDPGQVGQLKQLYGALSDDLEEGVKAQGPEAHQSYTLFNSVAKQNAGTQKTLTRAVNKLGGPEAVFKTAIAGSKDGATKISPIMESLDDEGKNVFRSTVLHRLGRVGGAADAPFDANTFLKNWQSMSPEAKNVMFNSKAGWGAPGNLRSSLDSLTKTLGLLKGQGYIKTGLGKELAGSGHGVMGGVIALLGERAAEAGVHVAHGNPLAAGFIAGTTAAALVANPIMSRVLTNPRTVTWLAQATKAPKGMVPVLLSQLNRMGEKDPDAKDLSDLIEQANTPKASKGTADTGVHPTEGTIYPKIDRSAGMQPLPGGGYGIPPESM